MAWGFDDTPNFETLIGYVTVNNFVWLTTPYTGFYLRGFNTVVLDLNNCSATDIRHFDTCWDYTSSIALAEYINSLPTYTVLVGVTADDAAYSLQQVAKDALLNIGVDVSQLQIRGKVAFIAQIGQPSATAMILAGQYGNNVKLNAVVIREFGVMWISELKLVLQLQ